MDLLLDTHAFIWFLNGDKKLPVGVKNTIADTSNRCLLSIASIWEIAIKVSLRKLELNGDFNDINDFLTENFIEILPVTFKHLQTLLQLEFYHKDPFDRVIIAQAFTEGLNVAAKDQVFTEYPIKVFWK